MIRKEYVDYTCQDDKDMQINKVDKKKITLIIMYLLYNMILIKQKLHHDLRQWMSFNKIINVKMLEKQ